MKTADVVTTASSMHPVSRIVPAIQDMHYLARSAYWPLIAFMTRSARILTTFVVNRTEINFPAFARPSVSVTMTALTQLMAAIPMAIAWISAKAILNAQLQAIFAATTRVTRTPENVRQSALQAKAAPIQISRATLTGTASNSL